ncbi:CAP-Gly domain-containing linker protein 1-like isoform X1 [Stegodyphus dumicola]|uniref:CAP-Gly domain-containing linker protein 1-like isoform X1 n=1 Tax=Stegodyphus dumicola TaxID=202533 RepID=UPI0015B0D733|nr:CAP-Gly domain-containing linker protein 1-like isoform X1 [Stegodyphus dumicola]
MADRTNIKMENKPSKNIPVSKIPTSGRDSGTHSRSSSVSNLTTASEIQSEAGDISDGTCDFKIDDRVWVNGSKPGYIKFIGKTQFAPGVWAGILLDEPVGKNDGSVAGVKYFTCEPQRGIFARPQKLSRCPGSTIEGGDPSSIRSGVTRTLSNLSSLSRTPIASNISSTTKSVCSKLRIGERVVVNSTSGIKSGILRFVGETEFAKGDWAGIELDEPVGKNDGSVAGKRYFSCEMKYGLFSPLHKVSRAGGTAPPRSTSARGTPLMRTASKDSLNSSVSNCSRTSRVKLGVTSLTNSQKIKSPGMGIMTNNRALEEALKEANQHIEQLLKERDLERAEVARLASHYKEVEAKSLDLKKEQLEASHARKILEDELACQKRKLEDLQFQFEEETIAKGELEMQLQQKNLLVERIEKFASENLGNKFINIKEIIENRENLSPVKEEQENAVHVESLKKIEELQKAVHNLQEEKEKISVDVIQLQSKLNDYEKIKADLVIFNNALQEKEDVISNLKNELSIQLEKVTQLTDDNQNLNKQIAMQAEQAKGEAADIITNLGEQIKSLNEELKTKSSLIKDKETIIQDKDTEIYNLKQNLESQIQAITELENQRSELNQVLNQKVLELTQNVAVQKALEDEISRFKSEIESENLQKEKQIKLLSEEAKY